MIERGKRGGKEITPRGTELPAKQLPKKLLKISPETTTQEIPDPQALSTALREMRTKRDLTVGEVSHATELPPLEYYAVERGRNFGGGRNEPSVGIVEGILDIYTARLHLNTGHEKRDAVQGKSGIVFHVQTEQISKGVSPEDRVGSGVQSDKDEKIITIMEAAKLLRSKLEIRPNPPEVEIRYISNEEVFRDVLRDMRVERGLSPSEVSEIAGIGKEIYGDVEVERKGKFDKQVRLSTAEKILTVYDAELHINTGNPGADVPVDVRVQLCNARKDKGFTQNHVAQVLGVTQTVISQIENKKVDPPIDMITGFARAVKANLEIRASSSED